MAAARSNLFGRVATYPMVGYDFLCVEGDLAQAAEVVRVTIAFWCLLAGGLLPVLVVFVAKADRRLDIRNPRDVHAIQSGVRKRAYGAHLNGHEAFPLFAAAVVIATIRGVPQDGLDMWALTWVFLRIGYTGAYLADLAKVRPVLWALSVLTATAIFVLPS